MSGTFTYQLLDSWYLWIPAFTAGWLDRGMEAIAGFLPSPLRAVFPVNLHHVRRKLTLLIQLLKNNGNCWFERLTIGGHRRLSANRMKRRPSPALCRSSHLSMLFYIKFWDLSRPFLEVLACFPYLVPLLYIKEGSLSRPFFWGLSFVSFNLRFYYISRERFCQVMVFGLLK